MKCTKCGSEIPAGALFCGQCGGPGGTEGPQGQNQFSQWWNSTAAMLGRDPTVWVVGIGALLLCLGSFLPWTENQEIGGFVIRGSVLGLQMSAGPVVLALGAIVALALVMARGGTPGPWSIVIVVLSAVCLVLIFQTMIFLDDHDRDLGAGVYVAMVGGFVAASGGLLEAMRLLKK